MIEKEKTEDISIYTEYFNYTEKHKQTYGEKTLVLMQVGAFYEIYGLKYPNQEKITRSNIIEVAEILNLTVSSKKYNYDGGTVYMAGFRDYTIDKSLPVLMENGYVVAEYIQDNENETKTKKKTRILKDIHSAGTYISYDIDRNRELSNYIMCIWIEEIPKKPRLIYGAATINIYTGESSMFENEIDNRIDHTVFDELENYISIYSPSEVIFISPLDKSVNNKIIQYIQIPQNATIHSPELSNTNVINAAKQKYMEYIINEIFGIEAFQICAEFTYYICATQAFCYLLNFLQEHNRSLSKKIQIPVFKNTTKKMVLANHTLKQLNIISDGQGHLSSVLSFLNKCNTAIGKRKMQEQITNPVFCENWLQCEYEMIDFFLKTEMVDTMRKQLSNIRDIEKISRQILYRKILPSSIYTLYSSIQCCEQLNICILEFPSEVLSYLYSSSSSPEFDNILRYLEQNFIISECANNNSFQNNIIQRGVSLELDQKIDQYNTWLDQFHTIRQFFMSLLMNTKKPTKKQEDTTEDDTEYIKINETDKNGLSLYITKTRGELLKTILKTKSDKDPEIVLSNVKFSLKDVQIKSVNKSMYEITIPILDNICKELIYLKQNIQKKTGEIFYSILEEFERTQYITLERIIKFLANIDVILCKAYLAKTYRYTRPEIITSNKSCVNATELRHILIEQLLVNELYVPNDISLGFDTDGILLYGTNAVGKTSLIRALGIAIIMAQSGMYVPCRQFQYKPYKSIYSRILGNDNLFKGLSTFAVEMSELRVILKNADEYSFILGDELCSGTETESALSIFMAALEHLYLQKSSFIFATHFHEIVDYEELRALQRIRLKHLDVWYDRETDSLVYDRKIKDGSGNRNYGLEVCKSLHLPDHFMERAYIYRKKYNLENDGSLSHHISHYNAKKIKGICENCHMELGEEIHHLQEQQMADIDGFINGFIPKNHPGNLLTVCKKCHDTFHIRPISPITVDSVTTEKKKIVRKKTTKGYILQSK